MGNRERDIARLIYDAEPDAFAGEQEAVERVSLALAKINGALLASTLLRHGDRGLSRAIQRITKAVELEARETARTVLLLEDPNEDPPDLMN